MLGDHQQRRTDYLSIPRTKTTSNGDRTPNSLLSGYTTNEADDERSSSLHSRRSSTSYFHSSGGSGGSSSDEEEDEESFTHDSMGSLADEPSYPGEDVRPTSRRELLGFYTYSFAAEVFVVCGLGAFIPIILEDLARASPTAVLAHDRSKPCKIQGISSASLLSRANDDTSGGKQCVFDFFGTEINTASFAMYTFSLSVLVQTLVVVTMSGAADHGRYRKSLLITFAIIGSVATMLFLPVTPSVYLLGSLWALIGNICIGASFVLLNSFLPLLVRNHPKVKEAKGSADEVGFDFQDEERHIDDSHYAVQHRTSNATAKHVHPNSEAPPRPSEDPSLTDIVDPSTALLPSSETTDPYPPSPAAPSIDMQISTKISSYGVGIGYSAAVIVQVLSVVILSTVSPQLWSLRLVLFLIGLWWLAFTIPALFWLRPRPGPPLATRTWLGYLTYSWKNLFRTAVRARRLRDVLFFLAAWFMISDAIATVSGTAILFAKTTLGMRSSALALINVIVTIAGIAGALSWSALSRALRLTPARTILVCICVFELIPIYGLLGYVPAIRRAGVGGLQQQWEIYPLAAVYGLVLGGLSSYCRSLFAQLIPPGQEAAFYALYAITDKGSSIFGPAVVGAITDATGEIRPAFWFLAVLIGLPIPLMLLVDVERGKREGSKLARETIEKEREAEEELHRQREWREEEAREERRRQRAAQEAQSRQEEAREQQRLAANSALLAGASSTTGIAYNDGIIPDEDRGHGKHGHHGHHDDRHHSHGDHQVDHHHQSHLEQQSHQGHHIHVQHVETPHIDHSAQMSHGVQIAPVDTAASMGTGHHTG